MLQRFVIATLLFAAVTSAGAATKAVAPQSLPHPVAMFLNTLCSNGKQQVVFKTAAAGTRFFIEEPAGVTVYVYDGADYRKEAFLKSAKLKTAMARYGAKP